MTVLPLSRWYYRMVLVFGIMLADPALAERLQKTTEIYRTELGALSPALDIYTKSEFTNAPVLIFVHGGGWAIGNKRSVNDKPQHFADNGYVFVSLDYRLAPDVGVGEQLDDIDAALGWIQANIGRFGGDPRNLHLFGHSAGAHLVTMSVVAPGPVAATLIETKALRSVISNDTRAYDIARIAKVSRNGRLPRLYAKVFGEETDNWRRFSPIHHLSAGESYPAFMILYSSQGNGAVRADFAHEFSAALGNVGVDVTVFDGRRYNHLQINRWIGADPDLTGGIDKFLAANS